MEGVSTAYDFWFRYLLVGSDDIYNGCKRGISQISCHSSCQHPQTATDWNLKRPENKPIGYILCQISKIKVIILHAKWQPIWQSPIQMQRHQQKFRRLRVMLAQDHTPQTKREICQMIKGRKYGVPSEFKQAPQLSNMIQSQEAPLARFWAFHRGWKNSYMCFSIQGANLGGNICTVNLCRRLLLQSSWGREEVKKLPNVSTGNIHGWHLKWHKPAARAKQWEDTVQSRNFPSHVIKKLRWTRVYLKRLKNGTFWTTNSRGRQAFVTWN